MKKKYCPFEKEVLHGLKSAQLKPELEAHRKECPVCTEAAAIYSFMNQFSGISEKKLPTAESLWDEAYSGLRTVKVKELEKKALRPLMVTRRLSFIFAIAVPLILVFSYLPEIKEIIQVKPESHAIINSLSSILNLFIDSFSFLLMPAAVCLLTLIFFVFITGFQPKRT